MKITFKRIVIIFTIIAISNQLTEALSSLSKIKTERSKIKFTNKHKKNKANIKCSLSNTEHERSVSDCQITIDKEYFKSNNIAELKAKVFELKNGVTIEAFFEIKKELRLNEFILQIRLLEKNTSTKYNNINVIIQEYDYKQKDFIERKTETSDLSNYYKTILNTSEQIIKVNIQFTYNNTIKPIFKDKNKDSILLPKGLDNTTNTQCYFNSIIQQK